jgi:hypothetical protein
MAERMGWFHEWLLGGWFSCGQRNFIRDFLEAEVIGGTPSVVCAKKVTTGD